MQGKKILRHCPTCNSTRITGGVFLENGNYVQKIKCNRCSYSNKRIINSAVRE